MDTKMGKIKYDGIISLGSFCQVSSALWIYDLKKINSPLDNFGIKDWTSISKVLSNRFHDFWSFENVVIGKASFEMSNKYDEKRDLIKAYDNKYHMVSVHNFLVEDGNTTESLKTFPVFRKKLKRLENIFLKQCELYDSVRFIVKCMNWPNPHDTIVDTEEIIVLINSLRKLRCGKPFHLVISIPAKQYDKIKTWAELTSTKNEYPELFRVSEWAVAFNNDKHPEWDSMLGDCELNENYFEHLRNAVIGDPNANYKELVGF